MATRRKKKRNPRLKKALRIAASLIVSVIAVAVFYMAVIIGQPTEDALLQLNPEASPQAVLAAQPPEKITDPEQIGFLAASFPAPLLRLAPGTDIAFIQGQTYDVAFEGGFARMGELTYQTSEGKTLLLQTIYPKRAFSLIDTKGYSLSPTLGYTLLHLPAVRMDSTHSVRFHLEGEEALYLIALPKEYLETAHGLLKLCQLEVPLS